MSEKKPGLKARLMEELKIYLLISAYLALFLAAFTTYRRLLLREYQVGYFDFGFAIVEALILGKLILIGRALGMGKRFHNHALIVPTLYNTLCFSILVGLFTVLEHVLTGLWRGEDTNAILASIVSRGKWEILARAVMFGTAFVPLFAAWEISRCFGEGKLFRLFFGRRESAELERPVG